MITENTEVLVGDLGHPRLDDGAHAQTLVGAEQPHAGVHTLLYGGVAAGPAEDEGDGWQQRLVVEPLDGFDPAGPPGPPRPLTAA